MKILLICFVSLTLSACATQERLSTKMVSTNPFHIYRTSGGMLSGFLGWEMNCEVTREAWWSSGRNKLVIWGSYPTIYQIVAACKKRSLKTNLIMQYGDIWPLF